MSASKDSDLERDLLALSQGAHLKYTRNEKVSSYGIVTSARGGGLSPSTVTFHTTEGGCMARVSHSPGMTRALRQHDSGPLKGVAAQGSFPLSGGFFFNTPPKTSLDDRDSITSVLYATVGSLIQDWCSGFDARIMLLGQRGCGKSTLAFGSPAMDKPCISLLAIRKCFEAALPSKGSLIVSLWSHDKNGILNDLLGNKTVVKGDGVGHLDGLRRVSAAPKATSITTVSVESEDEAREVICAGLLASGNFSSQDDVALYPNPGEVHVTLRLCRTSCNNDEKILESSLLVFDAVGSSTSGTPSSLLLRLPSQLNKQKQSLCSYGSHYSGLRRLVSSALIVQEKENLWEDSIALSSSSNLVEKQVFFSKNVEHPSLFKTAHAAGGSNIPVFRWDASCNSTSGPGLSKRGYVTPYPPLSHTGNGPMAHFLAPIVLSPGSIGGRGALVAVLGVMSRDEGDCGETRETLQLLSQAKNVSTRALRGNTLLGFKSSLDYGVDFSVPVSFLAWGESLAKPNICELPLPVKALFPGVDSTILTPVEGVNIQIETGCQDFVEPSESSKEMLPTFLGNYETSFMAALRVREKFPLTQPPALVPCEPPPLLFLELKKADQPRPCSPCFQEGGKFVKGLEALKSTLTPTVTPPCFSIGVQAALLPPPSALLSKDKMEMSTSISLKKEAIPNPEQKSMDTAPLQVSVGMPHHPCAALSLSHNWVADENTTTSSGLLDSQPPPVPAPSLPLSPPSHASSLEPLPLPASFQNTFPLHRGIDKTEIIKDLPEISVLAETGRGRRESVYETLDKSGLPPTSIAAPPLSRRLRAVRSLPSRPPKVASLVLARSLIRSLEDSPTALSSGLKRKFLKRYPSAPPSLTKLTSTSGWDGKGGKSSSLHTARARILINSPLSPYPMQMALTRVITPLSPMSLRSSSESSEGGMDTEEGSSTNENGREICIAPMAPSSWTPLPDSPTQSFLGSVSTSPLKAMKEVSTSPSFTLARFAQTQTEPLHLPTFFSSVEVQAVPFEPPTLIVPATFSLPPLDAIEEAVQTESQAQSLQAEDPPSLTKPTSTALPLDLSSSAVSHLDLSTSLPPPPLPSTPSRASPPPLRHTPGRDAPIFPDLLRGSPGPVHPQRSLIPPNSPRREVAPSRGSVLLPASPNMLVSDLVPTLLESITPLSFSDACVGESTVDNLSSETTDNNLSLSFHTAQAFVAAEALLATKNMELKASQGRVNELEDNVLDLAGRLSEVIASLHPFKILDEEGELRNLAAEESLVEKLAKTQLDEIQARGLRAGESERHKAYNAPPSRDTSAPSISPFASPTTLKAIAAAAREFAKKLRRSLSQGSTPSSFINLQPSPPKITSNFLDPHTPTPLSSGAYPHTGYSPPGLIGEDVTSPHSDAAIGNEGTTALTGAEMRASLAQAVRVAEGLLSGGLGVLRGQLSESKQRTARLQLELETSEPVFCKVALYKRSAEAALRDRR